MAEQVKSQKILVGTVLPSKMQNTIVVAVSNKRFHPVYKKMIETRKKYHVDDPHNLAKVGDTVEIIGCAPVSKTKRFRLKRVLMKGEE